MTVSGSHRYLQNSMRSGKFFSLNSRIPNSLRSHCCIIWMRRVNDSSDIGRALGARWNAIEMHHPCISVCPKRRLMLTLPRLEPSESLVQMRLSRPSRIFGRSGTTQPILCPRMCGPGIVTTTAFCCMTTSYFGSVTVRGFPFVLIQWE